jgi:hypothetical protein
MTEKYSGEALRDYLLGQLPEPEAERLDELSITDDTCAERIRAVEHDLVDAFARGELRGAALEQFSARYLTTPRGREAIRFAKALRSFGERSGRDTSSETDRGPATLVGEKRRSRGWLAVAAALAAVATASAWLVLDNRALRARVTSAELSRDELQRDRQLRDAEARQRADIASPSDGRGPSPLAVATLVLAPQLRSARQLPTVALTDGTAELPVQLVLEPVDYPAYDASLVVSSGASSGASSGGQALWRADRLIPRDVGGRKTIDLRLPATVLQPQDYLIRVSGVPARGASEIVGEYRFTVVR